MPPEGKPDIEDPEVAILKWWIDNGADPKKALTDFEVPAPIKEAISKLVAAIAVPQKQLPGQPRIPTLRRPVRMTRSKAAVAGFSKDFPARSASNRNNPALADLHRGFAAWKSR